jgi:hypothetical protein
MLKQLVKGGWFSGVSVNDNGELVKDGKVVSATDVVNQSGVNWNDITEGSGGSTLEIDTIAGADWTSTKEIDYSTMGQAILNDRANAVNASEF